MTRSQSLMQPNIPSGAGEIFLSHHFELRMNRHFSNISAWSIDTLKPQLSSRKMIESLKHLGLLIHACSMEEWTLKHLGGWTWYGAGQPPEHWLYNISISLVCVLSGSISTVNSYVAVLHALQVQLKAVISIPLTILPYIPLYSSVELFDFGYW